MSKPIPLTVRRLKEIMNEIPEELITDALVLVSHKSGEREYVITRTGQFSLIPNLTFQIVPNSYGLLLENKPKDTEEEI